jgi:hypothetical protein
MKAATQIHLKKYLKELKLLAKLLRFLKLLMLTAINHFKKQLSMAIMMP